MYIHNLRSDIDNMFKFAMDSLTGLLCRWSTGGCIECVESIGLCLGATDVETPVVMYEEDTR